MGPPTPVRPPFPGYNPCMIRKALLAGLLGLSAAVPALAAGDPAAVAAVEAFLREDEKAMLAGVLADKGTSAEFNADVKFAGSDAKIMKLVLDKWRGRIVSFAEADSKIGTPDVEGTYRNYGALMTPSTRSYMVRRLKSMKEADRNTLIEYLDAVDSALSSNGGKLTWYTKKVVAGIFDKYREDLGTYLPEPIAKAAKANAPAASAMLAGLRKEAETVAVAPVQPPVQRDPITAPSRSTHTAGGSVPVHQPVVVSTTSALEQARRAAEAAERNGAEFDGGGTSGGTSGGVVAGGNGTAAPLAPYTGPGGNVPNLTADVPSPVDPDDSFMSDIKKMKTGSGKLQPRQYLPGGLGAVIGGILGFFLGGPVGALIGAGIGLIAGDLLGGKLFQ